MTLLVDNRATMHGVPGLHALIIGISDYPFLNGPGVPVPLHHFGLRKVDGPAYSAWKIAEALQTPSPHAVLRRPLKTMRLLLAPSSADRALDPRLSAIQTTPPTVPQVALAASDWRRDCSDGDDEVALMFFAGHGLMSDFEKCLVCADFAENCTPDDPGLTGCGTFDSLLEGMGGPVPQMAIARQQAFFVDACLVPIDGVSPVAVQPPRPLLGPRNSDGRPPDNAGLWATGPGAYASALPGGATAFTRALLRALEAAVGPDRRWPDDPASGSCWPVTVDAIRSAVMAQLRRDPRTAGQIPMSLGSGGDWPLVMYDLLHPPPFRGRVTVLPPGDPGAFLQWSLSRVEGAPPAAIAIPALAPHPFEADMFAGNYLASWTAGSQQNSKGWFASLSRDELIL